MDTIKLDKKWRMRYFIIGVFGFVFLLIPWKNFSIIHIIEDIIVVFASSYAVSAAIAGEVTYTLKDA